jgi:hypothetical protein
MNSTQAHDPNWTEYDPGEALSPPPPRPRKPHIRVVPVIPASCPPEPLSPSAPPTQKKRKCTAGQRLGQSFGVQWMIFRVLQNVQGSSRQRWVRCTSTTARKERDNVVHRYDREIGFRKSDETEQLEREDPTVARTAQRRREREDDKIMSHQQRVEDMARFIQYVLERCAACT